MRNAVQHLTQRFSKAETGEFILQQGIPSLIGKVSHVPKKIRKLKGQQEGLPLPLNF